MSHGERAEMKSNHHKDFNGKRLNKLFWFPRGKITKWKTKMVERMMKKKLIIHELNSL